MTFTLATLNPDLFTVLVTALLSGGFITGIVAYRKAGPETESITVATLRGVIEELRIELERKDRQIAQQNKVIGRLQQRVTRLENELKPDTR